MHNLELLRKRLAETPQNDYPIQSRVHPLNTYSKLSGQRCYVKREDELGFGISGIKIRKYRTLLPALTSQNFSEVVVIGGAFSNHVLSLTQLLLENGFVPTLFLKGPKPTKIKGNYLLLLMLLPPDSIHWVSKDLWPQIETIVSNYATERDSAVVIPEGAPLFEGFLGALSLTLDILRNEAELGFSFDHLFIDAGTGYSAAALLLSLALLQKKIQCHLILLADTEEKFRKELGKLHRQFEEWLGIRCPAPTRFDCLNCTLAPSFGSTNRALFDFLIQTARQEGFFLDPIYSGKLFFQAKQMIASSNLQGNILLIHSGGALTLTGFQEQLELSVKEQTE